MAKDLKAITKLVKSILEEDQYARDSDSLLYFRVLEYFGKANGMDIHDMSVLSFLMNMARWGYPPFESVRRARQKVQAKYPHLGSSQRVAALRGAQEEEYRRFALDELEDGG